MQRFPIDPVSAVASAFKHRYLVQQLAWREISGRYRGSIVGMLWSFVNPLLLLAMYTFVFGIVFNARWGLERETTFDFSLILFVGLIVHQLFTECIVRAPALIAGNVSYVKQVVFPLEVLPIIALSTAAFHGIVSTVMLLTIWLITHGGLPWAVVAVPFILLPLCLISLGIGWFLSATSVYVRDIEQIVGFLSMGLLFLAPIFYSASTVPEPMKSLLIFNPLTYVVEAVRATLVFGELPSPLPLTIYYLVAIVVFSLGYAWFQKSRAGFADVL